MPLGGAVTVAAIGGLGSLASSIIGAAQAGSQRDAAAQAIQTAINEIQATGTPPDLASPILIKHLQDAGVYTPQMQQIISAGPSKEAQTQMDPAIKQAQMQALQLIQQRGQTGLGPQDIAALNQVKNQVAQDTEGKRQQIIQNMQSRGLGGSGAELAAALQGAQSGSNQESQQGLQIAGQASQNALQALAASGNLGTQLQQQGINLGLSTGSAADQMQRFNVANQMATQQQNTQAANQGQLYNLGVGQQDISNQNAELYRQAAAKQQAYQDALQKAGMLANAQMGQANFTAGTAAQTGQAAQNVGSGIGQAASGISSLLIPKPATTGGVTINTTGTPVANQ